MANQTPVVIVTFGADFNKYEITEESGIDGAMQTVEDALNRFTGGEGLKEGLAFRVNGDEVDASTPLRAGDVILLATERSAKGGYSGAA